MATCKECLEEIPMPELIAISKWVPLNYQSLKCWSCQFSEETTEEIRYAIETCLEALHPKKPLRFATAQEKQEAEERVRAGLTLALDLMKKGKKIA